MKRFEKEKPAFPEDKIARINLKIQKIISGNVSQTDPLGSYTGVPVNPGEVPVQDADDL